ncbi:MAG: hypothetical protein P1V51_16050 [Deltaproteobacteria bacterium]|nr:hypothetical protein [Deltaproteobacteria bacterium]
MRASIVGVALGGLLLSGCVSNAEARWFNLDAQDTAPTTPYHAILVDASALSEGAAGAPSGLFLIGGTEADATGNASSQTHRWQRTAETDSEGQWVVDEAWTTFTSSSAAPDRYAAAAAYHEEDGTLLVFGGFGLTNEPTASFFIRDLAGWTDHTMQPSPEARGGAVMFYDTKRQRIGLYGGMNAAGDQLHDLWFWSGSDWIESPPPTDCETPPDAYGSAAAYDPYREELIVAGTVNQDGTLYTYTWGLTDTCWNDYGVSGDAPPARRDAVLAVDPARGRLVLTGGRDFETGEGPGMAGIWEWDGWEWHTIDSAAPPVWGAAFASDRQWGNILLYGGIDRGGGATEVITMEYEGPRLPSRYNAQDCASGAGAEVGLALLLVALFALPRRGWLALLIVALLPAGATASEPRQIAYLGMLRTNGVEPADAETISGILQTHLGQGGKNKVIGPSDIQAMLGLEGQKQLLGCESDTSCLAELGGALGARHAAYADLSRLGSTIVFNLVLLDVENTQVVSRLSRTVKLEDTLEPVLDLLEEAANELFRPLEAEVTSTAAPPPAPGPEAPAVVEAPEPPVKSGPSLFAKISEDFYLQARVDYDLVYDGGIGWGLTLGWGRNAIIAPQVTLLSSSPAILRLEARLTPFALGPVHPYLLAGLSFSNPALAPRGAFGIEVRLGGLLLFVEGGYENYLLNLQRFQQMSVLVSGGAGWRF